MFLFQLTDFGLAYQYRLAKAICGSLLYIAPEIWYGTGQQSPKVDVWSLFVVVAVVMEKGQL